MARDHCKHAAVGRSRYSLRTPPPPSLSPRAATPTYGCAPRPPKLSCPPRSRGGPLARATSSRAPIWRRCRLRSRMRCSCAFARHGAQAESTRCWLALQCWLATRSCSGADFINLLPHSCEHRLLFKSEVQITIMIARRIAAGVQRARLRRELLPDHRCGSREDNSICEDPFEHSCEIIA